MIVKGKEIPSEILDKIEQYVLKRPGAFQLFQVRITSAHELDNFLRKEGIGFYGRGDIEQRVAERILQSLKRQGKVVFEKKEWRVVPDHSLLTG